MCIDYNTPNMPLKLKRLIVHAERVREAFEDGEQDSPELSGYDCNRDRDRIEENEIEYRGGLLSVQTGRSGDFEDPH